MRTLIAIGVAAATGGLAGAATIDGMLDAEYGALASIQNNSTGFGDDQSGHAAYADGSELDGAAMMISGGSLFIHLGGNLQSNFNKLELFIDARDGGQNRILGINPDVGFGALQRMGDDGSGNGLTFDAGFDADLYVSLGCGDDNGNGIIYYVDYAELRTNGDGVGGYAGSGTTHVDAKGVVTVTPSAGDYGIAVGINNSNTGGVIGGDGEDCGALDDVPVASGIEIEIPLYLIDWDFEGLPFDNVRVCAFINGAGHDWVSNQVLGGLGGSANLADPRGVDFNAVDGDQFVVLGADADPCVPPATGRCCFANGECWDGVTYEHCDSNRGLWGEGLLCEDGCDLGGGNDCPTDVDGSGMTDVDDLLELIGHFGEICP
ncbi:MAG: hypothetical protein QF733_03990 [Phycisphaerales bacterium]|jgi:hypothetical protein|nr:hypothetical protein [Phycisphaerales bacterium]